MSIYEYRMMIITIIIIIIILIIIIIIIIMMIIGIYIAPFAFIKCSKGLHIVIVCLSHSQQRLSGRA